MIALHVVCSFSYPLLTHTNLHKTRDIWWYGWRQYDEWLNTNLSSISLSTIWSSQSLNSILSFLSSSASSTTLSTLKNFQRFFTFIFKMRPLWIYEALVEAPWKMFWTSALTFKECTLNNATMMAVMALCNIVQCSISTVKLARQCWWALLL